MTNIMKVVGDVFSPEELDAVAKRLAPYTKDGFILYSDLWYVSITFHVHWCSDLLSELYL